MQHVLGSVLFHRMDSSAGALLQHVNKQYKYMHSQAYAEEVLGKVQVHRAKSGEPLVRPRVQVVAFAFKLEEFLASVLSAWNLAVAPVDFYTASRVKVTTDARVRTWWRDMHEEIRVEVAPSRDPATEATLIALLEEFMTVYMRLRCREAVEMAGVGHDAPSGDCEGKGERSLDDVNLEDSGTGELHQVSEVLHLFGRCQLHKPDRHSHPK